MKVIIFLWYAYMHACCINRYWYLKNIDGGDLSERLELKNRLQCHNFQWFLENVIPSKFLPDINVQAYGQVKYDMNLFLELIKKTYKRHTSRFITNFEQIDLNWSNDYHDTFIR